ncbi:hypothetical protein [Azoarcus sp. KH32C]|uniref:hypothetical protein n=1 Tax=Azoarcus sp. KH32C TaxID=748247 RepID=UPI0002386DAF|nr:hypothetical protein [Azoarcus sp. KH32C]BAL24931.1 hypothetical protein AZKH_2625 [Azoarcus sp. KH32C]
MPDSAGSTSTAGFVFHLLRSALMRYRQRTLVALVLVILAKLAAVGETVKYYTNEVFEQRRFRTILDR